MMFTSSAQVMLHKKFNFQEVGTMYKKILMLLLAAVIAFSAIPAKDGHAGTTPTTRYEASSGDYEYISELINYGDAITANQNDDYAYMWLSEVLVLNSKYPMSSVNASITSLCSTILYYDNTK